MESRGVAMRLMENEAEAKYDVLRQDPPSSELALVRDAEFRALEVMFKIDGYQLGRCVSEHEPNALFSPMVVIQLLFILYTGYDRDITRSNLIARKYTSKAMQT